MESHDQHCVHAMMVLPCLVVALTQPPASAADDMLAQSRGPPSLRQQAAARLCCIMLLAWLSLNLLLHAGIGRVRG